ncbi:MAG: efflux RND transporter periplasmic adaptor subunit [Candidatus Symbiothrix sp.]|jgi:RND family efflux transporter MFP subunit|nr:efflux RND transporter periplasmic adaptor subunit [Candidatus Symbiothrix sp.]
MRKIFFAALIISIALVGCKHSHNHEHDHEHEHCDHDHDIENQEHETSADIIHFHTEQQEKIDFSVELPLIEPFGQIIRTTAQVQLSPEDETIISARMSGIVLFSGNNLQEGQSVNTGQVLFQVSGTELVDGNFQTRFTEALNNYKKADADYKRAQELKIDKIVSEKDFLQIQADYEIAKTVYDNLRRNFGDGGQKISVPFQGFIKQVFVENGQFVNEGQPLVAVSKNKSLLLKADVRAKYATLLPYLFTASVVTPDKSKIYGLDELNGKILSFGKSINTNNYMIPVSIRIDNKAGFIPGGFVEIYLKTRSEKPVTTVPVSALTEEQGVYFVYVQLSPETFEKREVTVGLNDGIRTEILSGLDKDERIVSRGAVSVKLSQATGALDPHAGHIH